jgi:DNA-binding MarR family transcriptional regulator/ribosomal protein S18 acetylase RimI-like enzyme
MSQLHSPSNLFVHSIRDASRRLVREFGFMESTLADTNLHASAVHAVIEIGEGRANNAAALCTALNLEKSGVSRMLRKLIEAGEVKEEASGTDGREKVLFLTDKGVETLAAINSFADKQVLETMALLPQSSAETVLQGLQTYATTLRARRLEKPISFTPDIKIVSGYQPGIIGQCIKLHMDYYARAEGMGAHFEHVLAKGLGDLAARLDKPMNQAWAATDGDEIIGTIFIDGEGLPDGRAHLRAFIVSSKFKGAGIGRRLLAEAMSFVDEIGFPETHLFTFAGLNSALHLYKEHGFVLTEEWPGTQWGRELMEQRHVRKLRAGDSSL